jgi:SAM-dependent methyltransferase
MSRQSSVPTTSNLVEYDHPNLYDLENRDFTPQGPFYLALAQQAGGPVLELGCGTGRITIPLARHGVEMTGLDIVSGMLEQARSKAADLPIRWVEADARTFHIPTTFRLIYATTGAFQHMLERADQEGLLARVRAHLAPDGLFAFDVGSPQVIGEMPEEQPWFTYADERVGEVRVSGTCHYDLVRQVYTETAYRRWREVDGRDITHHSPLELRFFYPQELEALLHYNGFTVVEQYGDYDRGSLTAESKTMIYVCRLHK